MRLMHEMLLTNWVIGPMRGVRTRHW